MHPNAIQKIERKIKGSLVNCYIEDNWPQYESFSVHVESLGEEILKHKKEWLDSIDIFSIFYDLVYDVCKERPEENTKLNGNLWDLLGEEKGQALVKHFKDYILSIPRKYDIYIPIPNIKENLPKSIEFSENFSIVVFTESEQIPGRIQEKWEVWLGYVEDRLQLNKIYFKQRINGYCGKRLENICIKKAISNFKIILHQAIFRDLFKISPIKGGRVSLNALANIASHYEIPKINITSVDRTNEKPKLIKVELPLEISKLINNISFSWEDNILAEAREKGKFEKMIASILLKAIELIEYEGEESKRVKSAIEWCFNSYIVENQTLAFLQICIGLEALLGDEGYNGALTETLADRCSYLISSDIKGRKKIRDEFKAFYNIRSKLIHGNALELDSNQKRYLHWGKIILELAILKEIKHLNFGKL